ncbi:MAG: hypothetical protein ACREM8_00175 [Vulcanimicrobiaceae bacterium]
MIETAIAMPLFLLALFGIIWVFQIGVLGERSQLSVRYAGLISQGSNPLLDYSLYSMYNNLNGQALVTGAPCTAPDPNIIQGNGPTGVGAVVGAPFWQPKVGSTTLAKTCSHVAVGDGRYNRLFEVDYSDLAVSSQKDVPTYLTQALGSTMTLGAEQNFFKSVDVGTLLHCYLDLQNAETADLMPSTDTSAPTPVTPLPLAGTTVSTNLPMSGSC